MSYEQSYAAGSRRQPAVGQHELPQIPNRFVGRNIETLVQYDATTKGFNLDANAARCIIVAQRRLRCFSDCTGSRLGAWRDGLGASSGGLNYRWKSRAFRWRRAVVVLHYLCRQCGLWRRRGCNRNCNKIYPSVVFVSKRAPATACSNDCPQILLRDEWSRSMDMTHLLLSCAPSRRPPRIRQQTHG